MGFVPFTSFFPQEKNKEILSRNVVELQKKVRWALGFWGSQDKSTLERKLIS